MLTFNFANFGESDKGVKSTKRFCPKGNDSTGVADYQQTNKVPEGIKKKWAQNDMARAL